jgi:hypothetical protein
MALYAKGEGCPRRGSRRHGAGLVRVPVIPDQRLQVVEQCIAQAGQFAEHGGGLAAAPVHLQLAQFRRRAMQLPVQRADGEKLRPRAVPGLILDREPITG